MIWVVFSYSSGYRVGFAFNRHAVFCKLKDNRDISAESASLAELYPQVLRNGMHKQFNGYIKNKLK